MPGQPPTSRSRRYKITVASAANAQGQVSPLRFTWRGKDHTIASWGRHWQAADGDHYLVMTAAGRMFELVHHPQDGAWFLLRAAPIHSAV